MFSLEKRKSDDSDQDEEWSEVGEDEVLLTNPLPEYAVEVQLNSLEHVGNRQTKMVDCAKIGFDIKDQVLLQRTIQTLFSCIIANVLRIKPKLLDLYSAKIPNVVLKLNFKTLDFKVLFKQHDALFSVCCCKVEPFYCYYCRLYKKDDGNFGEMPVKIVRKIETDCFLLEFERDFGIHDITDKFLPFNNKRIAYALYFKTLRWLFSDSSRQIRTYMKMPTSIQGFRNHPLYCLEKTLAANEILLFPNESLEKQKFSIGRFKSHLVFPTSYIQSIYTRKQFLKAGLAVKENELPVKTSGKKEFYGEWQCIPIPRPTLTEDGHIPTNEYGNIEILHEKMVPEYCTWLPARYSLATKFLAADNVPVVVGFTSSRGRRIPSYHGIIVKTIHVPAIKLVHEEMQNINRESEEKEREVRVYLRWKKLVEKYLLQKRLEADYLMK
jgi:hypothetical protein